MGNELFRASMSKRLATFVRNSQPRLTVNGSVVTPQMLEASAQAAKIDALTEYVQNSNPHDIVMNAYRIANIMRESR